MNRINYRCKQRGFSLVEVLVALAIMAVGVTAVSKLMGDVTQSGGETKAKSQAVYLAQSTLENIRGQEYSDIASGDDRSVSGGNAQYTISQNVTENQGLGYKNVQVAVTWENASGKSETVNLNAVISKADELNAGKMLASASTDCVVSSRKSGGHDGESDHSDDHESDSEHGHNDHSSDHESDSEHGHNDHSSDHESDSEHEHNDHSGDHEGDSEHASNDHSDDHEGESDNHGDDEHELVATCDADVRTEKGDDHHDDHEHEHEHEHDSHHG